MAYRVFATTAEQRAYAAGWWAWQAKDPQMPYLGVPRTTVLVDAFEAGEADARLYLHDAAAPTKGEEGRQP